jgi:hypothetical protein
MLKFVKLECGCIGKVFEQDYEQYHGTVIDKNWITEIWSHLQLYDAKIQINVLWTPKPGREGGYIDNGTNNSTGNLHHTRVAGDQHMPTILAGILPVIHHGSHRTQHLILGQTGAQEEQQQQVGVAGPAKTDIMEGMETSSG